MSAILCWVNTGDSIAASGTRWPYKYLDVVSQGDAGVVAAQASAVYRVGNILCLNMAISGTKLETGSNSVAALAPNYVDTVYAVKRVSSFGGAYIGHGGVNRARRYLVTGAIGTNDGALGGYATPAIYAAAHATLLGARRTAGADLLGMVTLLPRGDGVITEPNRLAYNALLTDSVWRQQHGIDYCIDIAGDSIMGDGDNLPGNNGGDTTWYDVDDVHPSAAGSARIADNQVTPVMAQVLTDIG